MINKIIISSVAFVLFIVFLRYTETKENKLTPKQYFLYSISIGVLTFSNLMIFEFISKSTTSEPILKNLPNF